MSTNHFHKPDPRFYHWSLLTWRRTTKQPNDCVLPLVCVHNLHHLGTSWCIVVIITRIHDVATQQCDDKIYMVYKRAHLLESWAVVCAAQATDAYQDGIFLERQQGGHRKGLQTLKVTWFIANWLKCDSFSRYDDILIAKKDTRCLYVKRPNQAFPMQVRVD